MALLPLLLAFPGAAGVLAAPVQDPAPVEAPAPFDPVVALDALLFEDSGARYAFGGFRERRRVTDAPDIEEVRALFSVPCPDADVRAPLVDLGDGVQADLDRLTELGIELEGTIGVVALATFDPKGRIETPEDFEVFTGEVWPTAGVKELTRWAEAAGLSALLVAPPEGRGPFALVDDFDGEALRPSQLDVPVIRIRRTELEMIRERLRAKRVRGDDGKTRTVRVGPGPVEAHVVVRRASTDA